MAKLTPREAKKTTWKRFRHDKIRVYEGAVFIKEHGEAFGACIPLDKRTFEAMVRWYYGGKRVITWVI